MHLLPLGQIEQVIQATENLFVKMREEFLRLVSRVFKEKLMSFLEYCNIQTPCTHEIKEKIFLRHFEVKGDGNSRQKNSCETDISMIPLHFCAIPLDINEFGKKILCHFQEFCQVFPLRNLPPS